LAFRTMRTPLCRRTVSAATGCIAAVLISIDIATLAITTSIRVLAPVLGLNLAMTVAAVVALWHTHGPARIPRTKQTMVPPSANCDHRADLQNEPPANCDHRAALQNEPSPKPWWQCVATCLSKPPPPLHATQVGADVSPATPDHHLLPPSLTTALHSELLDASPLGLRFALLRIRTTGEPCTEVSLTPTLAFCDAALRRGQPFFFLLDCSQTGRFVAPPLSCLRMVYDWANRNATVWDALGQAIGIVMTNEVMRPLLSLATRLMKPPQPIAYAHSETRALAFLAEQGSGMNGGAAMTAAEAPAGSRSRESH